LYFSDGDGKKWGGAASALLPTIAGERGEGGSPPQSRSFGATQKGNVGKKESEPVLPHSSGEGGGKLGSPSRLLYNPSIFGKGKKKKKRSLRR